MAVERWQKWNVVRAGFTSRTRSRTRVLRTSDAVEVLVRTPAARPLRSEHRCAGDRASWPSSSGCTSPYTRCRGRRASSPRPASDPERNLGCALGRGASPRARVAVAPPWRCMCRARNEDEWTVAPGQRDEVSDDASVDDAGGNDDVPDLASCSSSETEPPTARPTSEPSPEASPRAVRASLRPSRRLSLRAARLRPSPRPSLVLLAMGLA